MAFTTSNVKTDTSGGNLVLLGEWSGAAGDASGTITLKGGRVYSALFQDQDSDFGDRPTPVDVSVSTGTITVTVHNHNDVTNGRFKIEYL